MKIELPKYNYTQLQLDELNEILNIYAFEFDTPEVRKQINYILSIKINEYILEARDKKINEIIDGTSTFQLGENNRE